MGENSAIEWCDHTFNPWIGCTKVGPGCDHCYAAEMMDTRYGRVAWGAGKPRVLTSDAYWRQPLRWNRDAGATGVRRRVFCASLADVFDPEVAQPWRDRLFALIRETPHLDWLLLSKRPHLMPKMLPADWGDGWENVLLGASVETQFTTWRAQKLARLPAARHFLSVEPLLEAVDLSPVLPAIQWVIVGGESGRDARAMRPEWARSLRDQCQAAGVPFLFKQWGAHGADGKRVGKKAAGRLLDGRTWDEFPIEAGAHLAEGRAGS